MTDKKGSTVALEGAPTGRNARTFTKIGNTKTYIWKYKNDTSELVGDIQTLGVNFLLCFFFGIFTKKFLSRFFEFLLPDQLTHVICQVSVSFIQCAITSKVRHRFTLKRLGNSINCYKANRVDFLSFKDLLPLEPFINERMATYE